MTTSVGNLAVLTSMYAERTDGQSVELVVTDPATDVPIPASAITQVRGTLRALDTNKTFYADAILATGTRVTYPAAGRIRVLFLKADMGISGPAERQPRRLTLDITYTGGRTMVCAVDFTLRNLGRITA